MGRGHGAMYRKLSGAHRENGPFAPCMHKKKPPRLAILASSDFSNSNLGRL